MNQYFAYLAILFFLVLFWACKPSTKVALAPQLMDKAPIWARNQSIYEVNTRQYSDKGTFAAVEADLPRLQKMGIGIVWFMPITPIGEKGRKGTFGSYYSVQNYTAVNPDYGTIDDFKNLVHKAHELGMYVIIDWVANHTSWDNPIAAEHPEWYTKDKDGNFQPPVADWSDVIDLDYNNAELRNYMIEAMAFWVRECDIDGFRADVAEMVPTDFWEQARAKIDPIKPLFWLAESEKAEHHTKAFDASYGWELHHLLKDVAQGNKNVTDLYAYFDRTAKAFPSDAYRLYFTTNHDENSWNGTEKEKFGEGAAACFALCATAPGSMPLLYTAQESQLDRRLKFFEKDPVEWRDYPMTSFYTALLQLKQSNPALWNGKWGGKMTRIATTNDKSVMAFMRQNGKDRVFVVLNLGGGNENVQLNGSDYAGEYHSAFSGKPQTFKANQTLSLKAWEYQVWVK